MRAASLETATMTKRFGELTVLDRVDMKVPAGSFHALLGENGAGKSTLVKCIMGSYRADEGDLILDGKETSIPGPEAALTLGLGMVYQHFTLVPSMTVAENMVLARVPVPRIINWKAERATLDAFLARMPFRVPLERRVSTLSAGEKQKVEILKLLNLGCRFLILDEPNRGVLTTRGRAATRRRPRGGLPRPARARISDARPGAGARRTRGEDALRLGLRPRMGGDDGEQVLVEADARALGLRGHRGLEVLGHAEGIRAHPILLGMSAGSSAATPKRATDTHRSRRLKGGDAVRPGRGRPRRSPARPPPSDECGRR